MFKWFSTVLPLGAPEKLDEIVASGVLAPVIEPTE